VEEAVKADVRYIGLALAIGHSTLVLLVECDPARINGPWHLLPDGRTMIRPMWWYRSKPGGGW
jgi:hypothetical protein